MRLFLLAGIALLVACSDSSDPGDDDTADIEGSWDWTANISNAELELTCTASGGATIEQSGDEFSGQIQNSDGICSGPQGTFPIDLDGALGSGLVQARSVSFEDDACEYTGVATGDPTDEIDGDVTCTFILDDEPAVFEGTWEMTR